MYSKTSAIILNSYNFGEADKLYRVFSRDFGKIACIGKGVRRIKSRRAPHLDTLNLVKLDLYSKGSYYYISSSSLINDFSKVKNNLTVSSWGFYILEALSLLSNEEEQNEELFSKVVGVLTALNISPMKRQVYLFLKELISFHGYWNVDYITKYSFLNFLDTQDKVSEKDQILIDEFFKEKIERITEKKLESVLLIKNI